MLSWGERLAELRARRGWTVEQAAHVFAVHRTTLLRLEASETRQPHTALRHAIACAEQGEAPAVGPDAVDVARLARHVVLVRHHGYVECCISYATGDCVVAFGVGVGSDVGLALWSAERDLRGRASG
jgi:DNA-binding XRE family transcriptional regulator